MHFSIVAGVVLSVALALAHYVYVLALALWLLSIPVMGGLLWAALYRVDVLRRSFKIHKKLGVPKEFEKESTKLQVVLLSIILMTFLDVALSIFNYFLSLSIGTIRNILLAQFYVKPAANLVVNYKREVSHFKTPFRLEEVLEGKIDIDGVKFGYSTVGDVEREVALSCESCGEIGACDSVCPAVAAGRLLSPRSVVRTVALNSSKPHFGLEVLETQAWACTTCGACVYSCPVKVNHLDVIYGVRRAAVAVGKVDKKIGDVFLSASQYGNTLSQPNMDRHMWLYELGVRHISESPDAEYLLWVGCMGSFDARARGTVKALVEIFKKAGLKIATLGDEETCCGDPL
ncbi:MAG: 4Fe-4S dicluster domain-containing protein, partial [Pyrobaculum sp.]